MPTNPYETPMETTIAACRARRLVELLPIAITHVLTAFVFASLVVIAPLPLHLILLLFWLAILVFIARRHFIASRKQIAWLIVGIQPVVIAVVITVAYFAPVKIVDQVLERSVSLPNAELTLGQLQELAESYRRDSFPIMLSVSVSQSESSQVIRFPGQRMTLRQFVTAVEQQSSLRHRFAHCGNGSTILGGGDCSFGLRLRDPKNIYYQSRNAM